MQQGPHTKPCLFTPLIVTFPLSFLPARCCCEWPAMLLLLSFSGSSSTLSAEAWISRSPSSPTSSSSSSSPGGRENRTALTRWTSTKGRSNWNDRSLVFLTDLTFSLEFMFLNVFWCYLILCVCVPVKVREKAQRVCFSHQDEVCRPVGQVSGWRKTLWAPWTWAWNTGERDTLEPAFNSHPLTWDKNNNKRFKILKPFNQ